MAEQLELIDLSSTDLKHLAAQLRKACLETGFFYVVNHGISRDCMQQVFEQSKRFFMLPIEDKLTVLQDENNRGYTLMKEEIQDPETQRIGDLKEGYYIGLEIPADDPRAKEPLQGPNQWPSPELLPNWRETMEKYFLEAEKLSRRIIKLIALALNLDANYFDQPGMFDSPMALLRLLHYPGTLFSTSFFTELTGQLVFGAVVSKPELGIFGAGAHTDYGMLTLLASDGVGGLQICKERDAKERIWKDVQPIEGAFVVNLGDMLERWTNGLFRSTLHRVVNPGLERYSIAFFMEPNFNCRVECIPTCCDELNPPKYAAIKSGDHLMGMYKATHKGFDVNAKAVLPENQMKQSQAI